MSFLSAITTLLLVMDPLGNVPICLSVLSSVEERRRTFIIIRESIIACAILLVFFFAGQYILAGFHITQAALTIAGGIILFLIALKMVFPPTADKNLDVQIGEPFIVPLAIPLLAGPSAIAMVMLFASQEPEQYSFWVSAIVISSTVSMLILLGSTLLKRMLGTQGLIALERLMGMLLVTLSVQMFLDGLQDYFQLAS